MTIGEGQEKKYDICEIVRLAAIFHDTGHMFFSHVSELYFSYDKSFPRYEEILSAKIHHQVFLFMNYLVL